MCVWGEGCPLNLIQELLEKKKDGSRSDPDTVFTLSALNPWGANPDPSSAV